MTPFPGGVEATANGLLILSLTASVLYLAMVGAPPSWRRTAAKAGSTALLAVLAFTEGGPWLLVAALALGALGDAFLALEREREFLFGLASFLAAHLAYAVLFAASGEGLGVIFAEPGRAGLAAAMALASAAMLARLQTRLPAGMKLPVGLYAAAILAMGIAALTLREPLVIAGAVLFMASDALLAAGRFLVDPASPRQAAIRPVVWVLYYLGQALIALGALT